MAAIAVLGYGTVGSGVVEVIGENSELIAGRGCSLEVKYILDLRDFPGDKYESLVTHDAEVIFADPEIKVICETMGGTGAAYAFTKRALEAGISVCTSNKELVEKHGAELSAIAAGHSCSYLFEASVGGGIPLIRTIRTGLVAENIKSIYGILNGTTNYILYRMEEQGLDFAAALKEAQEMGYAEKDPTADIEGHDPCRKIAILASLVCGKKVDYSDIPMEGLSDVSLMDLAYARSLGGTIKLIAMCDFEGGKPRAIVSPRVILADNPLKSVNDVFNAALIDSDMLGLSMYYGKGAGKLATASAVVADAVECASTIGKTVKCGWTEEKAEPGDPGELKGQFLVRIKRSALKEAESRFGAAGKICFEKGEAFEKYPVLKGVLAEDAFDDEMALVTPEMSGNEFTDKAAGLEGIIKSIRL
ncbi:MAG: homoserine dehydrogenase [Lachnospiraceae bacterium]|nr:homoserine dehydrogenase [Lachnospiraceae bacterium]